MLQPKPFGIEKLFSFAVTHVVSNNTCLSWRPETQVWLGNSWKAWSTLHHRQSAIYYRQCMGSPISAVVSQLRFANRTVIRQNTYKSQSVLMFLKSHLWLQKRVWNYAKDISMQVQYRWDTLTAAIHCYSRHLCFHFTAKYVIVIVLNSLKSSFDSSQYLCNTRKIWTHLYRMDI